MDEGVVEAWHINASLCALTRDDGSYFPKQYLHLIDSWRRVEST